MKVKINMCKRELFNYTNSNETIKIGIVQGKKMYLINQIELVGS